LNPLLKSHIYYPLSLYIGLRYTRSNKGNRFVNFVSLFSTGGILVGVMALIVVTSVMNGFEQQLKERILGAVPHVTLSEAGGKVTDWQHFEAPLIALPGVTAVAPMVQSEAMLQSSHTLHGALLEGIDPASFPRGQGPADHMLRGRLADLKAGEYRIILGAGLARNLGVVPGDTLRVMVTEGARFTLMGRVPNQRLFTVTGIFEMGSEVDGSVALVHAEDAARLIRLKPGQFSAIRLYLQDPFGVEQLARRPLPEGLQWRDWRDTHGELFAAVKMEKNMMALLLSLIVAVASFNILATLVMVVTDKESEVAILKTLGLPTHQIVLIFMTQGIWSAAVGVVTGGLLGLAIASNLNPLLSALHLNLVLAGAGQALPVVFHWGQFSAILASALLLALLATLYPAYRAAQVRPAEVLRYE